jgi:hypothetical protein
VIIAHWSAVSTHAPRHNTTCGLRFCDMISTSAWNDIAWHGSKLRRYSDWDGE